MVNDHSLTVGVKFWNSLEADIKKIPNFPKFKKLLKLTLLEQPTIVFNCRL